MNKLVNELKKVPFSSQDILEGVEGQTKIIKYSDIHKFRNINELLSPYGSAVILYQTAPNYGHWTCIHLNGDTLEFFDPYGKKIDTQLNHIDDKFRIQSNQDYPYLSKLMLESPYKLTYNNKQLQKQNNDVSSCGRHCTFRLILRDMPLKKYQDLLMSKGGGDSDDKITYLTAFI